MGRGCRCKGSYSVIIAQGGCLHRAGAGRPKVAYHPFQTATIHAKPLRWRVSPLGPVQHVDVVVERSLNVQRASLRMCRPVQGRLLRASGLCSMKPSAAHLCSPATRLALVCPSSRAAPEPDPSTAAGQPTTSVSWRTDGSLHGAMNLVLVSQLPA